jgi:hypothetical protein
MTLNTAVTGNCRLMGVMVVSSVQVHSPSPLLCAYIRGLPHLALGLQAGRVLNEAANPPRKYYSLRSMRPSSKLFAVQLTRTIKVHWTKPETRKNPQCSQTVTPPSLSCLHPRRHRRRPPSPPTTRLLGGSVHVALHVFLPLLGLPSPTLNGFPRFRSGGRHVRQGAVVWQVVGRGGLCGAIRQELEPGGQRGAEQSVVGRPEKSRAASVQRHPAAQQQASRDTSGTTAVSGSTSLRVMRVLLICHKVHLLLVSATIELAASRKPAWLSLRRA